MNSVTDIVSNNSYPGRGIIAGLSANGCYAVAAYFIMGRSVNSRNRIFRIIDRDVQIEPFDPSKVSDPSLIIYYPLRTLGKSLIVTNGDQTDTVYSFLKAGSSFEAALSMRTFEPDFPNFTPRISALLSFEEGFRYKMSILKCSDGKGKACLRATFDYEPVAGTGHFIHTYRHDGDPLPSFEGEPEVLSVPDSIDEFSTELWRSLNGENKVSLYIRYTDLTSGEYQYRLFNKHEGE